MKNNKIKLAVSLVVIVLLGLYFINFPIKFKYIQTKNKNSNYTPILNDKKIIIDDINVLSTIEIPLFEYTFNEPISYFSISTDNKADYDRMTLQYVINDNEFSKEELIVQAELDAEDIVIVDDGEYHSELIVVSNPTAQIQINNAIGHIKVYPIYDYELQSQDILASNIASTSDYNITNMNGTGTADSYYTKKLFEQMGLNIVTRREWVTADYYASIDPYPTVAWRNVYDTYRFVIHHTAANPPYNNMASYKSYMRAMHHSHGAPIAQGGRSWVDIGYNYVIAPDGTIFEGRAGGIGVTGAHAPPNAGTIGISLMGDYQNNIPPQAAMDSLQRLIGKLGELNDIEPIYYDTVVWHNLHNVQKNENKQPTACAGRHLIARINDITNVAHGVYDENSAVKNNNLYVDNFLNGNKFWNVSNQTNYRYLTVNMSGQDANYIAVVLDPRNKYTVVSNDNNVITIKLKNQLFHQVLSELHLLMPDIKIVPISIATT